MIQDSYGWGCVLLPLPLLARFSYWLERRGHLLPFLYILIFGGIFAGVPATLGLGIILAQVKLRKSQYGREKTSN
jgi:hypothetical protein